MRAIIMAAALLVLPGCETVRTLAPQTAAGFEANGVIGAVDGASGAIVARCLSPEGVRYRVALDVLAEEVGLALPLAEVRKRQDKACRVAGAVRDLGAPPLLGPLPSPRG